ncbi:hypothetical protein CRG98_035262 [Punica granatum]|uniref:Uncharacterized protein n=1 Tax=Punica granatum TaxID=22663 RepID=A0A2I0IK09_PUNGR|nr:hypothetical protein CRG98_035262 [Punica granatum]
MDSMPVFTRDAGISLVPQYKRESGMKINLEKSKLMFSMYGPECGLSLGPVSRGLGVFTFP